MDNRNTPSLTDRMKDYESAYNYYFTKRTPLIIRFDVINFSSWANGLGKFNINVSEWFQETVKYAMNEIPGCVFAFSTSDEISLFLRDWDKLNTNAWYNGNVQDIITTATSIITAKFNDEVRRSGYHPNNSLAHFKAHAHIVPKDEVVNYFIYRQHEGIRSGIQTLGQELFGDEVKNLKTNVIKQKIEDRYPENNWDSINMIFRNGFALRKDETQITTSVPLFKDDRQYIEELIYVKGEK